MDSPREQVVPGIEITPQGEVIADESLTDTLCDLAIQLEEDDDYPVDVEHVLAAVVLAVRQGEIDRNRTLSSADSQLKELLSPHVKRLFEQFGGEICGDN